jgi:hypothetical protein
MIDILWREDSYLQFLISNFRRVLKADEEYILHQAFEDGPDRGFRNVGTTHSDAGEIPKRKYTRIIKCNIQEILSPEKN